jgi:putative DNA primase/helicase
MPMNDDGITQLDQARAKRRARRAAAVGEDRLALDFAERHDGHFLYDHTGGHWLRWDNTRWRGDVDDYVFDCARALIREHTVGKIRTALAVERMARSDRRLARSHADWNANPLLLGTPNGVVDLSTGELMAADPFFMISLSTAVMPGPPGARCPLWRQFLREVTCEDEPLQRYLQQRAGYWLTGLTHREDFDFLWGPGGNGKGTFLHTIHTVMGDYATTAPINQFMVSRHDQHLCELARLAHARLVIASEAEEMRTWAVGKIKQLTGNTGRIAARYMHRDFFEFWPRFKLVFDGNSKPQISSVDEALARRLNLVPFRFRPAHRDEGLKAKLEPEYPAILRWAIDGWLDVHANGPIRPACVVAATTDYLAEENVIAAWLAERCTLGTGRDTLLKDLFADWKAWCEDQSEDPESSRRLKSAWRSCPASALGGPRSGSG